MAEWTTVKITRWEIETGTEAMGFPLELFKTLSIKTPLPVIRQAVEAVTPSERLFVVWLMPGGR